VGVVGIERDATLGLRNGAVVLFLPQRDLSLQLIGVAERVVQSNGPFGQLASLLEGLPIRRPQKLPALENRRAQAYVGRGTFGIELEREGEKPTRLRIALARRALSLVVAAEDQIVGLEHAGRGLSEASSLGLGHLDGQRANDLLRDVVLHGEDVARVAVVALRPQVIARLRVHQLRGDPHAAARSLHAAFEHVPNTEVMADVTHVDRFALVGEHRVPGDDEQAGDLRQPGDDGFGHAVAEILLRRRGWSTVVAGQRPGRRRGGRRPARPPPAAPPPPPAPRPPPPPGGGGGGGAGRAPGGAPPRPPPGGGGGGGGGGRPARGGETI